MPAVNPNLLKWARETAGLTIEQAARKLAIRDSKKTTAIGKLNQLESGRTQPSDSVLRNMAKHYRRPLITFYLKEKPRPNRETPDFRTLPNTARPESDYKVQALLRMIFSRHALIKVVLEDEETDDLDFVGSLSISNGREHVLKVLLSILGYSVEDPPEQREREFKKLRDRTEAAGVFTMLQGDLGSYHTDIEPKDFRGFAISDALAPLIVINDNDAVKARTFTLLHELVHILIGQTGFSGDFNNSRTQQFCNDVASEYLLPQDVLDKVLKSKDKFEDVWNIVDLLSDSWNVSRDLVIYRLRRSRYIDDDKCRELRSAMPSAISRHGVQGTSKGGPSFYTIKKSHAGTAIIDLVRRALASGSLPTTKAAIVLDVKPQQVGRVIDRNG